jgi:ribonuclease HII
MPEDFLIAGIDEAGRGAVAGPLVVAGVCCNEKAETLLRKIGVRDSKLLSPARREILAKAIEKTVKDVLILKIGSCKIDSHRQRGMSLNQIEGIKMAEVASFLRPHKVFIDSPDRNLFKFGKFLEKMIQHEPEIVLEHKADVRYPVVAAASILAKVERDREIQKLRDEHGELGSGYPSDPLTQEWLRNWISGNKKFPEFVRRSWVPAEILEKEKLQTRLSSWFKGRLGSGQPCGDRKAENG